MTTHGSELAANPPRGRLRSLAAGALVACGAVGVAVIAGTGLLVLALQSQPTPGVREVSTSQILGRSPQARSVAGDSRRTFAVSGTLQLGQDMTETAGDLEFDAKGSYSKLTAAAEGGSRTTELLVLGRNEYARNSEGPWVKRQPQPGLWRVNDGVPILRRVLAPDTKLVTRSEEMFDGQRIRLQEPQDLAPPTAAEIGLPEETVNSVDRKVMLYVDDESRPQGIVMNYDVELLDPDDRSQKVPMNMVYVLLVTGAYGSSSITAPPLVWTEIVPEHGRYTLALPPEWEFASETPDEPDRMLSPDGTLVLFLTDNFEQPPLLNEATQVVIAQFREAAGEPERNQSTTIGSAKGRLLSYHFASEDGPVFMQLGITVAGNSVHAIVQRSASGNELRDKRVFRELLTTFDAYDGPIGVEPPQAPETMRRDDWPGHRRAYLESSP